MDALDLADYTVKTSILGDEKTKGLKKIDYGLIIDRLMGRFSSLLKIQEDLSKSHRLTAEERQDIISDLIQLVRQGLLSAEDAGLELDALGIEPPPTLKVRIASDLSEPDSDDSEVMSDDELDTLYNKHSEEQKRQKAELEDRSDLVKRMESGDFNTAAATG
jgi:hypothetical protein